MPGPGRATNEPQNYFAMGVQGAKDQDPGTWYFFRHLDGSGFDTSSTITVEREGGSGRGYSLAYKSKIAADGAVITEGYVDGSARLIAWSLGQDTPSLIATAGGLLVNHQLVPGGSLPYLGADQTYSDESERTTNCVVSELRLDAEAGRALRLSAQFMSGGSPHIATTAMAAVRESGMPAMYPGASVSLIAGRASSVAMTKVSLTIRNALDDGVQTTGLNREDMPWLTAEYDVDGTIKYENARVWNELQYNGGTQVAFPLATGSFRLFAPVPGASTSLEVAVPLLIFNAVRLNRLDPDGKTMYLDFTGMAINGPTTAIYANVITGATGAYTATAT